MEIIPQQRILSLDASQIYTYEAAGKEYNVFENGKLNTNLFEGYLDPSIESSYLKEKYQKKYFYTIKKENYCTALVNVKFDTTYKKFNKTTGINGKIYVLNGYFVNLDELEDHVLIKDGQVIAIEVPFDSELTSMEENASSDKTNSKKYKYLPVIKNQLSDEFSACFEYDPNIGVYIRNNKTIPDIKKTEELRREFYKDGFNINGKHYVRYKRSAGSSRVGHCLFIDEEIYEPMMEWSACGLEKGEDLASWEAYIALTLSSIEKIIPIKKSSILILRDKESTFEELSNSVEIQDGKLVTTTKKAKITNNIFDGEALLEESVFDELIEAEKDPYMKVKYQKAGMVLLRQRFFKSCAFRTRLQDWFKDNKITKVEQLNGYTKAQKITDIKLVFTESSLKYIKMAKANKSKDYNTEFKNACDAWLNQMGNKVELGLVKTDKDTHHLEGRMVRTNYQMLNTLGLSNVEVKEFLNDSIDYLKNIKLHPIYLRHYINYAIDNEEHDIDTLNYRINSILSMMNRSNLFTKTKIYSNFQKDITDSFKKELRLGKVLVDGTYATIFGNPSEFLKATITKDYHKDDNDDPISLYGEEIYCSRFPEGQLLCCRSPHVTMGNLMLGENMSSFKHSEYFELSPNIVCVNAIKNNIQQKLNGCDYDSDTMLITDNPILLKALKRQKDDFLVPVYSAKPGKKNGETAKVESVQSEIEAIIKLDTNISKNKVGEIINLSQLLNSVYWHRLHQFENDSTMTSSDTKNKLNPLYQDICKLAVLSGLEIDKAKRSYNADAQKELNSIKSKYNLGETPNFLKYLSSKGTESTQNEEKYDTAMYHINKCFAHYNEKPNENGDIKYTAFKLPSCTYDTYLCELVNLPDTENERNNKNNKKYMEEILSIVKAANDELSSIRKRKRLKMDSENDDEKIQKCIEKCFIDVQDKIKNQTIVYKLLEKIDEEYKKSDKQKYLDDENIEENDGDDDTKYNVRSFSSLLFAAILYENVNNTKNVNHFFNMVKVEDFKRENLVLSEEKLTDDTIYNYHFVRQNVDSYLN